MTKPDPDYTTMNGAEFRSAVGADPERWAAAFVQQGRMDGWERVTPDYVVSWFRDAMQAAVKEARP